MFRTFAHLQRHPDSGIFYFRLTVPTHLRDTIGKGTIKKSLGTGLRAEAVLKAQRLHLETLEQFHRLEKRMAPPKHKPVKSDKALASAAVLAELEGMSPGPDNLLEKITLTIAGQKVVIEGDSPDEEVKAAAKLLRLAPTVSEAVAPKSRPKKEATVALSAMVKAYFAEVKATGTQTEKTIEENGAIFQLLVEQTKNPAAETIGIKTATDFKSVLLRLPPNRTKGKFAGKSVSEILRMKPAETMANESVNKYLRRISALFDWGKRHGHVHENPFSGLAIRRTRLPHQQRERFNLEELQRLFDPANLHRDMRKSYQWWLPWLGLLSGARLEELCQLHLGDIRQEGEVWCLDINAKEKKKLKTLSSERLVPIHPRLVELGFLEHVERLRKRGEKRLFPELEHRRDGYGQTASKWFARYRERLGVGKTFHSLRHVFIDELHQLGADHKKIATLVGHADESMTGGRYSKPFRPDVLLPVVEMLKFDL